MDILLHIPAFLIGMIVVIATLSSAIRTFVLPRSARDPITRWVFRAVRKIFEYWTHRARSYEERDEIMALYAPISLLLLPVVWLALVQLGYMAMFWAVGIPSWELAFKISGSSLLTLGFAMADGLATTILMFSEAALGLILVALLIAYLPTMYTAFQRRETAVSMLEVRAGSPPSASELLQRYNRIQGLGRLGDLWAIWEIWFADIEESHTSLAALTFFRSPQPGHSWVTAAGAVLDAASLTMSALDIPRDPQAALCVRGGYVSLRHIADFFRISYNANPQKGDPISVTRQEFDSLCDELATAGLALKPDREAAWVDFVGWRVNYDTVLLALAELTMAPYARWSSDRGLAVGRKGKRNVKRET